jgi:hypothetical protein
MLRHRVSGIVLQGQQTERRRLGWLSAFAIVGRPIAIMDVSGQIDQ